MLTNKDIRVEDGNIVINGDKYPLDGQSPEAIMQIVEDNSDTTPTEDSTAPITSGGVYDALNSYDNTTVQQLNIFKNGNMVSIYGLLQSLSSGDTLVEYATLDAKYRPASDYAIGSLLSTTAPYNPVGSVWVNKSNGKVSIYKEAARTDGYLYLTYLI